ncbi:MAG: hypothetical protein PW734_11035 [Verrucomicrobium sp.]|nr:hypothetical protein [Verrucomicrobium sp.]
MRTFLSIAGLAVLPLLFGGCTSIPSGLLYDVGGAGAGAAIGSLATKGNPYATAGGAVGGLAISELAQGAAKKGADTKAKANYDRGQSDSVKELYWAKERAKKPDSSDATQGMSYLEIPVDEDPNAPVKQVPHTRVLPVLN